MESKTVFVDNLHDNTSLGTLWKEFAQFGHITNVYRPLRRRIATNTKYAFIEYECKQQTEKAIRETNGKWIDGNRIAVQLARPLRKHRESGTWIPRPPPPTSPWFSTDDHNETTPSFSRGKEFQAPQERPVEVHVHGPVELAPSAMLLPKLDSSITIYSTIKTTIGQVEKALSGFGGIEHVISKSAYEFIVIFQDEKRKRSFLSRQKWRQDWRIEPWSDEQGQVKRVVNVVVRGLPPQAWSETSVINILTRLGKVVELETDMSCLPRKLEVFAVIETETFKIINEEIQAIFDSKVVMVGVIEVWTDDISEKLATQTEAPAAQSPPHHGGIHEGSIANAAVDLSSMSQLQFHSNGHVVNEQIQNVDVAGPDGVVTSSLISIHNSAIAAGSCSKGVDGLSKRCDSSVDIGRINFFAEPTFEEPTLLTPSPSEKLGKSLEIINTLSALMKVREDTGNIKVSVELPISNYNLLRKFIKFDGGLCSKWDSTNTGNYKQLCPEPTGIYNENVEQEDSFSVSPPNYEVEGGSQPSSPGSPVSPFNGQPAPAEKQSINLGSRIPNGGLPFPVDSNNLKGIELEVVLSPTKKSMQKSKHPISHGRKSKQVFHRPSAEAQKCFKYGQRLGVKYPYPSKSLANIDRILRSSGKMRRTVRSK